MRDLLPAETAQRKAIARRILEQFRLAGYDLVVPPAFELAEVLERGLGTLDPDNVLRFVEPESGQVAALRPDMTPQIARMVATRLASRPLPIRLCYEGTVVRRRQGRARRGRQIPQAGVELFGVDGIEGDLEVLRLACGVARAVGLNNFVVDLGHARVAGSLLDQLSPRLVGDVAAALARKDVAQVAALLASEGAKTLSKEAKNALLALSHLHGGAEGDRSIDDVLREGRSLFAGTAAEAALDDIETVCARAKDFGNLCVDLGEVRGFAYYTGLLFHILAEGPGEPVASGGRYDNLLSNFDMKCSAVGFGLHLDALLRTEAGAFDGAAARVLVGPDPRAEEVAAALRNERVAAATYPGDDLDGYARAWGFPLVLSREDGLWVLRRLLADGVDIALRTQNEAALVNHTALLVLGSESAN